MIDEIMTPRLVQSAAFLSALLAADYIGVLVALLADLRSGVLAARRAGEPRTSRGYRATVDKASRYYLSLFAMTAIDAMIVAAVVYVRLTAGWNIPPFPLFTTAGAIGLSLIELKSVLENTRGDRSLKQAGAMLKRLLDDPELRAMAKSFLDNR